MRNTCWNSLVVGALLVMVVPANAAGVLKSTTRGTPPLKSIQVLSFAPGGVLLVGDGAAAQIIAIQTNDKPAKVSEFGKISEFNARLGERMGTAADGVEILDMAVNPESGRAYFAVRKQDDKNHAIVTVSEGGRIDLFPLDNIEYARVELKSTDKSPVSKLTDVAWAEQKLIAAAATNEEFASKIFVVEGPITHDAVGELYSAETYHVSHRKWETRAPMSAIMPIQQDGATYIVGAFACTPVVKYPLASLSPGAKVKGTSVLELGSGNRPLDMFTYEKDGREYVVATTFRFHHERAPLGPSPYWGVRFDRQLLDENERVNENAPRRQDKADPSAAKVTKIDALDGVMQADRLGDDRLLVLRIDGAGRIDLEAIPLP